MKYYPLRVSENLTGRIGDYWLENGKVKYYESEWKDVSPPESLYTKYEQIINVKVFVDPPISLLRRLMAL
jgi:endo-alpha-1,4-polygalactosaminidase (GH114 family)